MKESVGLAIFVALGSAACAPSSSESYRPVYAQAKSLRHTLPDESDRDISKLLEAPLSARSAVQIALARNQKLRADFAGIEIAAGAIADATAPHNPEIDAELRFPSGGESPTIEVAVTQDILSLITIPARRGAAKNELRAAQLRAQIAVIRTVAETKAAYYEAVAAEERLVLFKTIFASAEAGLELARELHRVGNLRDLDLFRSRDFALQARVAVTRARRERLTSRARLNSMLGLFGKEAGWSVPAKLPAPASPLSLEGVEGKAVRASLELRALRELRRAATKRGRLALIRRFVPELAIGVSAERESEEGWGVGPAIRLGLPLWNWNTRAVRGQRAKRMRATRLAEYQDAAIRAQARAKAARLQAAGELAKTVRDSLLPLRGTIVDETNRHVNAMNASPFELLLARQQQISAASAYVDSTLEYWLAHTELSALLQGSNLELGTNSGSSAMPGMRAPGGHDD